MYFISLKNIVLVFLNFKNWNFVKKSQFYQKIEILSKKIEILKKNRNFMKKSKFCQKIEILSKKRNFVKKSTFCKKIEILLKNWSAKFPVFHKSKDYSFSLFLEFINF